MAIRKMVQQELAARAGHIPPAGIDFSLPVAAGRIESRLLAVDAIGCSFEHLTFCTSRLDQATPAQLLELGDRLARKVTYLLEPIHPLELDPEGFTLQLRSSPPQRDDDGSQYYELLARRGELTLCRYQKRKGESRRRVPAEVTREIYSRLAEDLAGAVA